MDINYSVNQQKDKAFQLEKQENKQAELLGQLKDLVNNLEKHTFQQLEEDINRGYGVFNKKLVMLSSLSKIDEGLRLIDEGIKGLRENFEIQDS